MKIFKNFALALCLAMLAINTSQAVKVTPPGTQHKAYITLQGGSNSALKWAAPLTAPYKVHIFVPKTGDKTNALYRVYPKGKLADTTTCSSTDLTYPCYEVVVNQTLHRNAWTQLTLNGDVATQWDFVKTRGYVTAVASNLATTQVLNLLAFVRFENVTPPPPSLAIGQTYQGGIIFYLDGTGQHGLVAAPTDQNNTGIQWYNGGRLTGTAETGVGTGQANTTAIVANIGGGTYAAKLCDDLVLDGYSDWYLPSKDELNFMYTNIGQGAAAPLTNIGGFVSSTYWSSSEYPYSFYDAWLQNFGNGRQDFNYKNGFLSVRAVRSF